MNQPWLQSYQPGIPARLDYPQTPLYRFLQDSAANYPDRPALIFYDGAEEREISRMTYRELDQASDRFAAALIDLGVSKGDRVAYYLQNSPELVVGFYGIMKAGAVAVPCNVMYHAHELSHHLSDSGATTLLCQPDLYPTVQEVIDDTPIKTVILSEGDPQPGTYSLPSLLATHSPGPLPAIDPHQDLALLPYTGGTTGVPKGAMLSHFNLVANATQFRTWFDYEEGQETFIACLPLFHIGGIAGVMSVPISAAATIVLFRRFYAKGVLQAIQKYGATRFLGVPTMYIALLNMEESKAADLSTIRPSRTSAAPLPKAVKEAFDQMVGHEVLIEGYGLTETSPLTHVNPVHRAIGGSIGLPLPDTDAQIVDADTGKGPLPLGEVGELLLRGPQIMRGYWNQPEATAESIKDGWFYTGDLAQMDEQGYFYIVDRKKDVINAAGFKVWPREVEEVLYQHPQVRVAAVLGVPDSYRGETVKAVISLKETHQFTSDDDAKADILSFCQKELAAYKIPRIVEFQDELPISAAGKVLRRVLRDEASESGPS